MSEERTMQGISALVEAVRACRASLPPAVALLVGVSGIDGSGKGYLAGQLVTALSGQRLKAAAINVDGWLNVPAVRFDAKRLAENFYCGISTGREDSER
jgi:uridine kinase